MACELIKNASVTHSKLKWTIQGHVCTISWPSINRSKLVHPTPVQFLIMATPIKLLQYFQKIHRIIGIFPSQPNERYPPNKLTRIVVVISLVQFILSSAAFFMLEAKSMLEYGFSYCVFSCGIQAIVVYLLFVEQSQNTLGFIVRCERFIENSEYSTKQVLFYKMISTDWFPLLIGPRSTAMYKETNENVTLLYKVYLLGQIITYSIAFFGVAPYSYIRYYFLNMGRDSFHLASMCWCVLKIINACNKVDHKRSIFFCSTKVSIWMESTFWIFRGMGVANTWLCSLCIYGLTIPKYDFWCMLAVCHHRWRYYARCGRIQHQHYVVNGKKSYRIEEAILHVGSDPFGCKRVSVKGRMELPTVSVLFCRCVMRFNKIIEYPLFVFVVWDLFGLASMLVTIQFELVE